MLDPEDADMIIGDEDPAESSAIAHTSAWALLGVEDEDFTAEAVQRLREVIATEGVDSVAHLWSRSPEFTLPGALWRTFLLSEWVRRDTELVRSRYRSGIAVTGEGEGGLDLVMTHVTALFEGQYTDDDLEAIFGACAQLLRTLATGENAHAEWIQDPHDPLAYPVTTRAQALLRTADELDEAAQRAHIGTLE
ncbi:MAG: hypothetical protein CSA82_03350 [Actinobacteria bacterium]|nr:MAG: hypothetical protein CSA82_03350 [Actinomycetota bacterium]